MSMNIELSVFWSGVCSSYWKVGRPRAGHSAQGALVWAGSAVDGEAHPFAAKDPDAPRDLCVEVQATQNELGGLQTAECRGQSQRVERIQERLRSDAGFISVLAL